MLEDVKWVLGGGVGWILGGSQGGGWVCMEVWGSTKEISREAVG